MTSRAFPSLAAVTMLVSLLAIPLQAEAAPAVTTISPTSGPTNGGIQLTLTGSGFVPGALVQFRGPGGNVASGTAINVTGTGTLKVTTPAQSASAAEDAYDIIVTNPDLSSSTKEAAFTYKASTTALTLTRVTPSTGSANGGTIITLNGTGFSTTLAPKVTVGGVPATVLSPLSPTRIVAMTGGHAPATTRVDVTVQNPDGTTAALTGNNGYIYSASLALPPTLASLSPTSGTTAGGTKVTLTGANFAPGANVFFTPRAGGSNTLHAAPSVTYVSSTQLEVQSPFVQSALAGGANVTVANPSGLRTLQNRTFTYQAAAATLPTVTSLQPSFGPASGGNPVVVTGTNFAPGPGLKLHVSGTSEAAVDATYLSSTQLRVTMPPAPLALGGTAVVKVENPDGRISTSTNRTYDYHRLVTVTGAQADTPPLNTTGGAVTITGTGFSTAGCRVLAGGVAASSVTCVSATTVKAILPPLAAGVVDVRVVNAPGDGGAVATLQDGLAVVPAPAPLIDTVGPSALPTNGGTVVTIVGRNFTGNATVTIDNAVAAPCTGHDLPAAGCELPTSTLLRVIARAYTTDTTVGSLAVKVINADGRFATSPTAVGYQAGGTANDPTVDDVSPRSSGSNGGNPADLGDRLTITGSNFHTGANAKPTVTIGGTVVMAADVEVSDASHIRVHAPPHLYTAVSGIMQVKVTNPNGESSPDTPADDFTYTASPFAPTITSVSSVSSNGGSINITGSNFVAGPGGSVQIDSTVIPFCAYSLTTNCATVTSTKITLVAPHHAATAGAQVKVTNPDGHASPTASMSFTAAAVPQALSSNALIPTVGVAGSSVTIRGSGFARGDGTLKVKVNGTDAPVLSITPNDVTFRMPALPPGPVPLVLTNPDGQSVTVTGLRSLGLPSGISVTPARGSVNGGVPITFTGTGFDAFLPPPVVLFGGTPIAATSVAPTRVVAAPPPAAAPGLVRLTLVGQFGQTVTLPVAVNHTYTQALPPTFTAISPSASSVNGGTLVTVSGSGFARGARVCLDTREPCLAGLPGVEVVNDQTLRFTTPHHTIGPADIAITNPNGDTLALPSDRSLFSFLPVAGPTLASVTPASGDVAGGTAVTLRGANFASGATVTFNGTAAASVVVVNATSITARTPPGRLGPATVTVTVLGVPASLPNGFTYTRVNTTTTTTTTTTTNRTTTQTTTGTRSANLTADQILRANQGINVTVTRDGGDNVVNFTLPGNLPAAPAGVQVFRSTSPYALISTLAAGTPGFAARSYRDVGAPADASYKVTVYYAGGVGKATSTPDEIPGFDQLDGAQSDAAQKSFITKLAIGIGIGLLVALLAVLAIILIRRRRAPAQAEGTGDVGYVAPAAAEEPELAVPEMPQGPTHTIHCPVCKATFEAVGEKPLRLHCPNCHREGILR